MVFLTVVTGCMFSGKTTFILEYLNESDVPHRLYVPPQSPHYDSEAGVLRSRSGLSHPAKAIESPLDIIDDLRDEKLPVVIDEAQFFPSVFTQAVVDVLLRQHDITVMVAGLDTDFRGQPYGQKDDGHVGLTVLLMAMADQVVKLRAKCTQCGGDATRTQRLDGGKPASYLAPTMVVEGAENITYEARCVRCHELPLRLLS